MISYWLNSLHWLGKANNVKLYNITTHYHGLMILNTLNTMLVGENIQGNRLLLKCKMEPEFIYILIPISQFLLVWNNHITSVQLNLKTCLSAFSLVSPGQHWSLCSVSSHTFSDCSSGTKSHLLQTKMAELGSKDCSLPFAFHSLCCWMIRPNYK